MQGWVGFFKLFRLAKMLYRDFIVLISAAISDNRL